MTIENTIFSFPSIDPVAISFGPLQIRWYALAYISAFMISWLFLKFQIKKSISVLSEKKAGFLREIIFSMTVAISAMLMISLVSLREPCFSARKP